MFFAGLYLLIISKKKRIKDVIAPQLAYRDEIGQGVLPPNPIDLQVEKKPKIQTLNMKFILVLLLMVSYLLAYGLDMMIWGKIMWGV